MKASFSIRYLERNKTGSVCGGNTRTSVPDRLVGNSKFSKVHADHFGFNLNTTEHLSVVDSNNRSNHLGDDDHVTQMGLNSLGLLSRLGILLGTPQTFDESHRLPLQSTAHTPPGAGTDKAHELLVGEVEQFVKINSLEGKFPEGTLLAKLSNFLGVHYNLVGC